MPGDHKEEIKKMGLLTALYLQGAVLLIQWISSQVHHTCSCGSYPGNICDGHSLSCLV